MYSRFLLQQLRHRDVFGNDAVDCVQLTVSGEQSETEQANRTAQSTGDRRAQPVSTTTTATTTTTTVT